MNHFLVCSSFEETWINDSPILFLGEWCRKYDRRHIWQNLDAEVIPYHWDNNKKFNADYLYLESIYENLLIELSESLNRIHGENRSLRYWRILIGPWLAYFCQILFDRWTMIRLANENYKILGARIIKRNKKIDVANDMEDAIKLFISDDWNEAICGELLKFSDIPIEEVDKLHSNFIIPGQKYYDGKLAKFIKIILRQLNYLLSFFSKKNEFFFMSTYLPVKREIALQLMLGQLPKLWQSEKSPKIPVDYFRRGSEFFFAKEGDVTFPTILRMLVKHHLPTLYFEGYSDLISFTNSVPWPKSPKVIFTSNSYLSDDVFKSYAAQKVEGGALLVLGQHGGNCGGVLLRNFGEDHQLKISDKYLSWGWTLRGRENVVPIGNFKTISKALIKDFRKSVLLVEFANTRMSLHMCSMIVGVQWLQYFDQQCRFVQSLSKEIQSHLQIRLFSEDRGWFQKERWLDRFTGIAIDDGLQSIDSLIKRAKIVICTYSGTTYLDTLVCNVPTVMFWAPKHWEQGPSCQVYFDQLKSAGIYHETPESAANHLTKIWNNIDAWWQDPIVQKAREDFCEFYSKPMEKPITNLRNFFTEIA